MADVVHAQAEWAAVLVLVAFDRGHALAGRELADLIVFTVGVVVAADRRADTVAALFVVFTVAVAEAFRRHTLVVLAGPRREAVAVEDALELRVLADSQDTGLAVVAAVVGLALGDKDAGTLDALCTVTLVVGRTPSAGNAASAAARFTERTHQVGCAAGHVDACAAPASLTRVAVQQVAALGPFFAVAEVALLSFTAVDVELTLRFGEWSTCSGVAGLARSAVSVVHAAFGFLADTADASEAERAGIVGLAGDAGPADTTGTLPIRLAVAVFSARGWLAGSELAPSSLRTLAIGGAIRN